jgi:hypothetical protein
MAQSRSRQQWIQNALSYLLENVFDIATIVIAVCIFIRHQFKPYDLGDIAELATWIIALLGLVAVSALWPQHRRLRAIETLSKKTLDLVLAACRRGNSVSFPPTAFRAICQ